MGPMLVYDNSYTETNMTEIPTGCSVATKFRKIPVVIEAVQWFKNGDHPEDHDHIGKGPFSEIALEKYWEYTRTEGKIVRYFRHPSVPGTKVCSKCDNTMHNHGWIDTLEGGHTACPGDWIITGVEGEFYPVKNRIFLQTYEKVVD